MNTDSAETGRPPEARVGLAGHVADLSPAYFGMVMATGIVSIACHLQGLRVISRGLFVLNCAVYLVLWCLYGLRLAYHRRRVLEDLIDHLRGPGYFTAVAATCVLGSQFVQLERQFPIATALWTLAVALWIGLTYTIFAAFTVKEHKPALDQGISGAWLLAVVATQSIAMLGALLGAHSPQPLRLEMNFLALSMWLWGGMFYIWMISLIFFRYTFFPFSPSDLSPPYWINMGAMAISTLAGSLLIINTHGAPFLHSILPFMKGFTIFYWATGTWWIPMLFVLLIWRHGYRRFPLTYDPLYWGAVFPLGMYATATHRMIQALGFGFLDFIPQAFVYLALAAWMLVFMGLISYLVRSLRELRT
ncbi:MAG: tellurite resistance/C4-dicarboxylate transporter family protein [Chthonomonadales bacterium]|nr:tellurite resistance/C4-dicarboxylate transporter family protein [Chthonomonadales bacterium]